MFDECLYFNTSALARRLEREWTVAFEPFGLTPPQAFTLRAILDHPGLLQGELAAGLAIARPTATRALDTLEAKGLIRRVSQERDGREQALQPTSEAIALKAPLNEASGAVTRKFKRLLGAGEFSDVVAKLRAIRTAIE
jgi:MarR family transcriptional regulator, temperature-dependent positive regulator of motility